VIDSIKNIEVVAQWETVSLLGNRIVIRHERGLNYMKRPVDNIVVDSYLDGKVVSTIRDDVR
jgi:hypothetical protein